MRVPSARKVTGLVIAVAVAAATLAPATASPAQAPRPAPDPQPTGSTPDGPRRPQPEDRYALAGGCYAITAGGAFVERAGDGFAATASGPADAEPFHLQASDLARYLLFATAEDYLAAEPGPVEQTAEARATVEGRAPVTGETDVPRGVNANAPRVDAFPDPTLPATVGSAVVAAGQPSPAADWFVRERPAGGFSLHLVEPVELSEPRANGETVAPDERYAVTHTLTADGGELVVVEGDAADDPAASFGFRHLPATNGSSPCAAFPEVEVNVTGPQHTADTPYEATRGFLDAHLHMMAFEFLGGRARCGQPWHPYGVTFALVDCPDHEPGGAGAALEAALNPDAAGGHDTTGWPDFPYWPRYNSLTHEQVYYRWLERAWRGGLRMFVNLLVENSALCDVYPYKRNSCNDMDGVRLQARRLHELQDYIDAQAGGPGEGWLRIVTDPFEARRVANAGKLAVVMGIEVSTLFDCAERRGVPRCDEDQIDRQLDEVADLGVRQLELVNKFDNALSGVTGDGGATGAVVNQGNLYETGHYWQFESCPDPDSPAHDKTQPNVADDAGLPEQLAGRDALAGGILSLFGTTGAAPVYGPGPHCNVIGLTGLGEYLLEQLMQRGLLFDPDHMSARARQQALDVLEGDPDTDADDYSGVVSSHSWADPTVYPRVYELGGVVTPYAGGSAGFVDEWREHREWADDRFLFGFGYGADTNGFGPQGAPRDPGPGEGVSYPFTGFGGVTVNEQQSGNQTYDINTDGVDHYGLYPDWIEDLRVQAGDAIVEDLERGPEAYLQMWERAVGIAPDSCRTDVPALTAAELDAVEAGMTPRQVLETVGQPTARQDTTFEYCLRAGAGRQRAAVITFGEDGTVERVTPGGREVPARGGGRIRASAEGAATASGAPGSTASGAPERASTRTGGHDHHGHTHAAPPGPASADAASARSGGTVGSAGAPAAILLALAFGAGLVALGLRGLGVRGRGVRGLRRRSG